MEFQTNQKQVETKKCKHCGMDIPAQAKVCPYCNKKQKHTVRNVLLIVLGVVILLGVLFSCMGGSNDSNSSGTATTGNSTQTNSATTDNSDSTATDTGSQSTQSNFTVGQTADNDGQTVTLDSVTTYAGTEYSQPPEGMEYLVLNWSFTNNSDTDFTPYSGMFDVYADGSAVQQYYGNMDAKEIGSQTLIKGTNETGSTTYEVPIGWQQIQVRVVQNLWTKQNVTFTITPDQVS